MSPKRILALIALLCLTLLLSACASVSAQAERPIPLEQTWYVDVAAFNAGAHAGLDCAECHTALSMDDVPAKHPDPDKLTLDSIAEFDYRACERCHPQEYAAYTRGVHAEVRGGTRKPKTDEEAPKCGNCHTPHYETANRPRTELIASQAETCGECHPKERNSYLSNYHGKAAVNLADSKSAACTDCHGGHQVMSLTKEPDALNACQKCHPTASTNMAGFLIHAEERIPEADGRRTNETWLLFGAKAFFTLLIVGTLGFFYGHTLLWLIRSAQKRMRGG